MNKCMQCGIEFVPSNKIGGDEALYCPEHYMHNRVVETGETIEEIRNGKITIGDLRDAIIEAAVEFCHSGRESDEQSQAIVKMFDAVDAYHAALREAHKEGK